MYYMTFWKGLGGTLWLSALTVFFGTLLGMFVALLHMGKSKILRGVADIYIEILRGTPILLQLYFFWIGLPKLVPFELTDTQCILTALIVNASAYISEIIRAGINAVDKGQWEAARSIGLTETNVMTRVILPQAVKNILPALCNEFIVLIKETSVAGYVAVQDLTKGGDIIRSRTYDAWTPLLLVAGIYLLLTCIFSAFVKKLEINLRKNERS